MRGFLVGNEPFTDNTAVLIIATVVVLLALSIPAIIILINLCKSKRDFHCSKCNLHTLKFTEITREVIGTAKVQAFTAGDSGLSEKILETRHFKCSNCGHETSNSITYVGEQMG